MSGVVKKADPKQALVGEKVFSSASDIDAWL
jgi:hypothetical protein